MTMRHRHALPPVPMITNYTEANPRKLPDKLNRSGNSLKLVKRNGRAAMYSVNGGPGVEVIRVRVATPSRFPNGTEAPWREEYPGNEAFGRSGWYYMPGQDEAAEAKFALLSTESQQAEDE